MPTHIQNSKFFLFFFLLFFLKINTLYCVNNIFQQDIEQIDQSHHIIENDNLFFKKNDFYWPIHERSFSKDYYQKDKTITYYTLPEIIRKTLNDGFVTKKGIEELYRFRHDRTVKLGEALPRLSLHFDMNGMLIPIDLQSLVGNLFNFAMPHRWIAWANALDRYNMHKLLFLHNALDQYFSVQSAYYELSRSISAYEINMFYLKNLYLLNKHVENNFANQPNLHEDDLLGISYVKGLESMLESNSMGYRYDIGAIYPMLASLMNLKGSDRHYFDIVTQPIPFNLELKLIGPAERDQLIEEVLKNSLEIKSYKYLIQIAKKETYIELSQDVLATNYSGYMTGASASSTSSPPGINYNTILSVSFGIDTIPRFLITRSHLRESKIDLEEKIFGPGGILERLELAINDYNRAVEFYSTSQTSREKAHKAFLTYLNRYTNPLPGQRRVLLEDIDHTMEFCMVNDLLVNNSFHDFLIATANLDRLRVAPVLPQVLKDLPLDYELKKLKKWIERKETGMTQFRDREFQFLEQNEFKDFKDEVTNIRTIKDVEEIMEKYKTKLNNDEMFKHLIQENMNLFLSLDRGTRFYRALQIQLEDNHIPLTDSEKRRLRSKERTRLQKLFRRDNTRPYTLIP